MAAVAVGCSFFVDGASLFVEVPAGEGARNGLHARLNGMLPRRTSDDESRLEGGRRRRARCALVVLVWRDEPAH